MAISLILATIHRTEEVCRLVQSLLIKTHRCFELIVVDQNLDGRLLPYVRKAQQGGLDVHHVRVDKPGLSANALARYDIPVFPDDDCWYEAQAIEQVRRAFEADAQLKGAIGCWVEQAGATPPTHAYLLDAAAWRQFRGGNASSISLFFNCPLFQLLGDFDERFGVGQWYGAAEETDLVLRALATGAGLRYSPEVRASCLRATPDCRLLAENIRAVVQHRSLLQFASRTSAQWLHRCHQ